MKNSSLLHGLELALASLLIAPSFALPQEPQPNSTLVVNGQTSQVPVLQINGRPYADLEALARAVHGAIAFTGDQISLTLPGSSGDASAPTATANPGLSKGFLKAGIEAMASVREWHSALATAIQNGIPIAETWLAPYRDQAVTNLRLASVAISTDSDRRAFPLLTAEFNNMKQLSDKYVAKRQSLTYIPPDSLQNDPLDQKIVNCGHSLAAMAASGQFQDDGSCQ